MLIKILFEIQLILRVKSKYFKYVFLLIYGDFK